MIIVLDCNIWVSFTINKQIDFIVDLSQQGIEIATCQTLRNEIIDVLSRPKLNRFIELGYIEKVGKLHDLITVQYDPGEILNIVADPKDNYLFALCLK